MKRYKKYILLLNKVITVIGIIMVLLNLLKMFKKYW